MPRWVLIGIGVFAAALLVMGVMAIPATAVLNDAGLDYVMVIENGVVQRRAVHIGMHAANDNLVEVLDGLTEGEQVLAVDLASLEPGTAVQLTSALPPD